MPYREYAVTACRPQNVKLYGLEVLASSEDELLARTYEWLPAPQTPGGVKTAVNYVMLDTTSMSVRTGDNIASFELPRYYGDQCYFLTRDEKSLTITRLAFHCSEWNPSEDFSVSELTTVNGN